MPDELETPIGAAVDTMDWAEEEKVSDHMASPWRRATSATSDLPRDPLAERASACVQLIAAMKATQPEVIRATRLHRLRVIPWLWKSGQLASLHSYSEVATTIDEFWSHSWQAAAWAKALNVLMLNHGRFAFVVSNLLALLVFALVLWDITPPLILGSLGPRFCSLSGLVAYYLALVLCRRSKTVFLDIASIDQTNPAAKAEGLVSLGAFLKLSKSMLVFWHPTFVKRLWCVFELSAFIRSRPSNAKPGISICTPMQGVVLLGGHFAFGILCFVYSPGLLGNFFSGGVLVLAILCMLCLVGLVHAVRSFCRSVDEMEKRLRHFCLDGSSSTCCDEDHPFGSSCDRNIILPCIVSWFGSVRSFESLVQHQVREILAHQLRNENIRYFQVISVTAPIFWRGLDITATIASDARRVPELCRHLASWLAIVPCILILALRLAQKLKSQAPSWYLDLLLSAAVVLFGLAVFISCTAIEIFAFHYGMGFEVGAVAYFGVTTVVALVLWHALPVLPSVVAAEAADPAA